MSERPSSDEAVGRAFLAAWPGVAGHTDVIAVGARLGEAVAAARVRSPGLHLDPERFARFVAARAPGDGTALEALGALRLDELCLVAGCLESLPAALARFEAEYIDKVPRYLARLKPTHTRVDEVKQALRARLLVRDGGGPARIATYAGRGSLDGWVRVAAMRLALDAGAADRDVPAGDADEVLERAVMDTAAPAHGFETQLLKAQYRADVTAAFREALAALEPRARLVLRLHYLDGMTPAAIGQLYAAHRTTAQRWIEAAEADLLGAVREGLRARLRLSATECDSLLGLLRSQLEVSLSPLLAEEARR